MESLTVVLEDRVTQPDAGHQTPGMFPDAIPLRRVRVSRMKPFLLAIFPYFEITAIATHIWTVVIAFHYGGFLMGVGTLILPGPAEVYWIFKLLDNQPVYAATAILHLLLIIPLRQARKGIAY